MRNKSEQKKSYIKNKTLTSAKQVGTKKGKSKSKKERKKKKK
jgi:hypothetical protein